jgi:hypothetical protein
MYWRAPCIRTPLPRAWSGVQCDQVLIAKKSFHGADAPWLDAGSSPA